MEKFEKSIFPFTKCIQLIPREISYIHERAKAHQMIGMHHEAVADFNVVIKRNRKNAHAYFRRAFSQKAMGALAENPEERSTCFARAADDFEQAKELDIMNP